ncbi:hypothetical protein [Pseudomonas sp. 5P_5.1_Bac1]|uniref:hypothetical protein n=1 Tax=Pseudomonas sp. 5P_5.1_Bac1 TaxID=2971616 RepID=UPI0021C60C51|nr:hypothetical protein [Pseudomonas sp. 5P_5.1_Bac1]MCU1720312.1 hypothetical protein [Pseudomonas sp. 5P_5.1_Bac1]
MDWIDLLQWPAMLATVLAAWWIASQRPGRRRIGFFCFIASNLLWAVWGWHTQAWALIVLQACLFAMNLRGLRKNDTPDTARAKESTS